MFKVNSNNNNEQGSIIIFTVLMVASILTIALTLTAVFLPKIRSVLNASSGSIGAIYAADSGLEWCIYTNRGNPSLAQPTMSNGSTFTITPNDCITSPLTSQVVGTYQGVSRSLFTSIATSSNGPVLTANPAPTQAGQVTTVSWKNIANPTANYWIGLYPVEVSDFNDQGHFYAGSCSSSIGGTPYASGSCSFTIPNGTVSGDYQFRLFENAPPANGLTRSAIFTIQP